MIIEDLSGKKYELNKTRMWVTDLGCAPWFIRIGELRAARRMSPRMEDQILYSETNRKTRWVRLRQAQEPATTFAYVPAENNKIGCRTFSPETFAKILKAAGVKPVRKTKPAKKGKK